MTRPLLLAALVASAAPAAHAQDLSEGWSGRASLYGWFSAAELDSSIPLRTGGSLDSSVSASLADVLDALDFAAFANFEARRGRLVVLGDVMYTKLSTEGTGPLGGTIRTGMKTFLGLAAAGWEVWSDDRAHVDLFGGGRVVNAEVDLSRTGRVGTRRASASETFLDPVIGARVGWSATDRLDLRASADIGGFGIGSQFSWEAYLGGSYAITERVSGELGFRYLSIDYENGGKEIDLDLFGPVAGLSIAF